MKSLVTCLILTPRPPILWKRVLSAPGSLVGPTVLCSPIFSEQTFIRNVSRNFSAHSGSANEICSSSAICNCPVRLKQLSISKHQGRDTTRRQFFMGSFMLCHLCLWILSMRQIIVSGRHDRGPSPAPKEELGAGPEK